MRPTKIKEKTLKYKGHNLLVSAIMYNDSMYKGLYEVGVFDLDNDFEEKELLRMSTREDCDFYFDKYVKKYTEKKIVKEETPIPKRYLKFAKDYVEIYENCKSTFNPMTMNDGNASNFDSCVVYIGQRVKKGFLNAALKPYKLRANLHENAIYIVVPYTQMQGDGNTIQAEYMCEEFKKRGYESFVEYRID